MDYKRFLFGAELKQKTFQTSSSLILECRMRDMILNCWNEIESMCNSVSLEFKPISLWVTIITYKGKRALIKIDLNITFVFAIPKP